METQENIYGLDCEYFTKTSTSISGLIDIIMESGMDPSYEITKNGKKTGEIAEDFIVY